MLKECSFRIAAFTALGVLILGPVATRAQTAPPAQKQTPPTKSKSALKAKPATPVKLQLDPKAIAVLKAVSNRLAATHTLSFVAVETFESLSRQGAPLVYANRSEVTLQRPDKLRVILSGDGPASEFYCDGKTMMAYAPAENAVAITNAPPTIDACLEAAYKRSATYFPFTDLIVADPYGDMAPGLKHAYYVGQSQVVGGTTTDIVAYSGDGVFVQMWVGTEDKLPRVIHAVYLDDPNRLRHNLMLSDWKIDAPVGTDFFTSAKAAGAKRMEFAHPHPEGTTGRQPAAKTRP